MIYTSSLKLRTTIKGRSKQVLKKDNVIIMVKSSAINIIGGEAYSFSDGVKCIIDESFSDKRLRLKNTNKETLVDSIINHSELSSSFRQLYKVLISISDNYKLSVEQQKREIDKLIQNAFPGALLRGVVGAVGASTGQVVDNIGGYLG